MRRLMTIDGTELAYEGRLVTMAGLAAPWYESIEDPERLIAGIRKSGRRIDILTFFQRVPWVEPLYDYYREPYEVAVIEVDHYDRWFNKAVHKAARNSFRKSVKCGVDVREVLFDDSLMQDIYAIYNETPVRQGRRFPHYGRSFNELRAAHATYLAKSLFLGAYWRGELIAFAKLVFENDFTDVLQILGKISHREKAATTGLICKAVEVCVRRKCRYLAYGDWGGEGLGDFKRHMGFLPMGLPRYYIPLNTWGRTALRLGLHRPTAQFLPNAMRQRLKALRRKWYELSLRRRPDSAPSVRAMG